MSTSTAPGVGPLLRDWRQRRRLSQLDLAGLAEVSARHLSWVETGRSRPTSAMVLRLADRLEVPLRERNALLLAAGHAPQYPDAGLSTVPMAAISDAIAHVLAVHQPYPAVVVDEHWDLVDANAAASLLLDGAAPHLLEPPVNALRLTLHPEGMAPRILNLGSWRAHLLHRLARQVDQTGDPVLAALHAELLALPGPPAPPQDAAALVIPLHYRCAAGDLALLSMTTVFGAARAVTLSELTIETFHPADDATAALLHGLAGTPVD